MLKILFAMAYALRHFFCELMCEWRGLWEDIEETDIDLWLVVSGSGGLGPGPPPPPQPPQPPGARPLLEVLWRLELSSLAWAQITMIYVEAGLWLTAAKPWPASLGWWEETSGQARALCSAPTIAAAMWAPPRPACRETNKEMVITL